MPALVSHTPARLNDGLKRRRLLLFPLAALIAFSPPVPARADSTPVPSLSERDVLVRREKDGFTVDVVMLVPVAPALAWAVMTDFEHMGEFLPGLTSSRVLERSERGLKVSQAGRIRFGPFTSAFESVREITLEPPREIRARGTGGSLQSSDSLMRLLPEGAGTRIIYHAEIVPGRWFPPLIGPALVRHETADQFAASLREMLRRAAQS